MYSTFVLSDQYFRLYCELIYINKFNLLQIDVYSEYNSTVYGNHWEPVRLKDHENIHDTNASFRKNILSWLTSISQCNDQQLFLTQISERSANDYID